METPLTGVTTPNTRCFVCVDLSASAEETKAWCIIICLHFVLLVTTTTAGRDQRCEREREREREREGVGGGGGGAL